MAEKKVNWSELIKAYTLKNALEHEGKALEGSVINALFHEGLGREEVRIVVKDIKESVKKINSLTIEEQEEEYNKLKKLTSKRRERKGLPELPGARKGKVIMRFRPAPSGPLHIGHIVSNMISSLYVKNYGGKFYIFIDDTNPGETLKEAYKNIKEDCDWLFGNVYEYINASDRIKIYYKHAELLIKKGKAYVCTCSQKKIQENRVKGVECGCRQYDVKEHLRRWEKMLDKKGYKEGKAVLRFKGNMQDKNPAFRDFLLARINLTEHPLQGNKYRVWPLMSFSVTVDDMDYKMTHVIRGKDHRDNAERQKMIYYVLGKEKIFPWTFFIGRIKFTDLILSKRKIKAAIERGEFGGFEDPRLPTISSLRKRGYKPEAFAKFVVSRGLTEVDKVISQKDFFQILDQFNK